MLSITRTYFLFQAEMLHTRCLLGLTIFYKQILNWLNATSSGRLTFPNASLSLPRAQQLSQGQVPSGLLSPNK